MVCGSTVVCIHVGLAVIGGELEATRIALARRHVEYHLLTEAWVQPGHLAGREAARVEADGSEARTKVEEAGGGGRRSKELTWVVDGGG